MINMVGLLSPLKIGGLELKNRIVLPPMATERSTSKGEVTDELIEHYKERAGDLGLMIVEHSYVHPSGRLSKNQLGSYSDDLVPGLTKLVDAVHEKGTPIILQINHAGGKADEELIGQKPFSSSEGYFDTSRKMTIEDIDEIRSSFVDAAERAEKAGFDGVEIHGAHGFLLGQFTSPLVNKREDQYGGDLENRMRFPMEIVRGIADRLKDTKVLFRLGSTDLNPEGLKIEESVEIAKRLEDIGVDMIDVSGNMCGSRPGSLEGEQGYFVEYAAKIKDEVDVPVIGVGGITEPRSADLFVKEGKVDLVAVGREQLKDPNWAKNAVEDLGS